LDRFDSKVFEENRTKMEVEVCRLRMMSMKMMNSANYQLIF